MDIWMGKHPRENEYRHSMDYMFWIVIEVSMYIPINSVSSESESTNQLVDT